MWHSTTEMIRFSVTLFAPRMPTEAFSLIPGRLPCNDHYSTFYV
jgi:hypothetical protein